MPIGPPVLTPRRGTHRVLTAVDPSIHPKNRNHPWLRLMDLNRDLSVEEQQELQAAMDTVCAQLLSIPFSMLPETVRARYDPPDDNEPADRDPDIDEAA